MAGPKLTGYERSLMTQIAKRLETAGLSVAEVARRAGLPRETVARIIKGQQRGSFDVWEKIDKASQAPAEVTQ